VARYCFALACCLCSVLTVHAYVDLAPTLGRIVGEAESIALAEVDKVSADKRVVTLKTVRALKGETPADRLKHQVLRTGESAVDRAVQEWAEPGQHCIVFTSGKTTLVCLGEAWYQVYFAGNGWSQMGTPRPDLPLAYFGSVARLADAIPTIVAGKSAVITTLPHRLDQEGASFDLALNRANLPGLVKVQRVRASLRMPGTAMGVGSNEAYLIGPGRVSLEDLPSLSAKLRSNDAAVRGECATELGFLGAEGKDAKAELAKLLEDPAPRVRLAAAGALLRIHGTQEAVKVLAQGLASAEASLRRLAARGVVLAGKAGAPLADQVIDLLADADPLVRRSALQAVASLGPAAAKAVDRVAALLDEPDSAIDAADALGRIGIPARSALARLTPLLASKDLAQRWAAVRAMSQIGGPGAAPAVDFMVAELPRASELNCYNMMIYLSLLGPVAKPAIPAIQKAPLKNPFLRQTTIWAIEPGEELPGMGGGPFVYIFEAYVQECDHLKPTAHALAAKIISGKAGNVPLWGYKLLARFPEQSMTALTPGLKDEHLATRERVAVALGYMGPAAAPARLQVSVALNSSQNERERRLLQWCLRQIDPKL
jgi:HEAT repeat protein